MKQHLAKSLLMAGALVASYPLLAQQMAPVQQQAQPMPATQAAPAMQPAQAAPSGYAVPAAPGAPVDVAQQPAAANPYAKGSMETVQMGVPPAPGAATVAPAPMSATAVDPASMSLPPDALGTRLGQRNRFLDGA